MGYSWAWLTNGDGKQVSQGQIDSHQTFPLFDPARTKPAGPKDYVWMLRWDMLSPARKVGEKYVLLDAIDTLNVGRRVCTYIPGQRRVKLAPDLAYDTPSPVAGGAATMDQSQVFNGAQDLSFVFSSSATSSADGDT